MGQAHTQEVTQLQLASIPHRRQVVVHLFLVTHLVQSLIEVAEVHGSLQSEVLIVG